MSTVWLSESDISRWLKSVGRCNHEAESKIVWANGFSQLDAIACAQPWQFQGLNTPAVLSIIAAAKRSYKKLDYIVSEVKKSQ